MRLLLAPPVLADLRGALRDLAVASDGKAHRTYAVLGEIPGASREELMDLGRFLVRLDITSLVAVAGAGSVHAGAVLEGSWGAESRHVPSVEDALTLLGSELRDDDVVLLVGLPTIAAALEGAT